MPRGAPCRPLPPSRLHRALKTGDKRIVSSTLVIGAAPQTPAGRPADRTLQQVVPALGALGLAICAVAAIDLALAWWPLRFGNGEWEFAMVTRTMDSLALGTTGAVFLSIWAVVRRSSWALALLGVLFVLAVVALVGCLVVYGLTVPVAFRAVPEQAASALKRGVLRTSSFGLIYVLLYGWLGWFTWRGRRAAARGVA